MKAINPSENLRFYETGFNFLFRFIFMFEKLQRKSEKKIIVKSGVISPATVEEFWKWKR